MYGVKEDDYLILVGSAVCAIKEVDNININCKPPPEPTDINKYDLHGAPRVVVSFAFSIILRVVEFMLQIHDDDSEEGAFNS